MGKSVARIVVGMVFGDECKGSVTDFFCREYDSTLVVRYNGGSQAAHNVVTPDGRHHTFAQIGSGAFVPKVKTLLSRFMFWDPIALSNEVGVLSPKLGEHALDRHFIDERAPMITLYHVASNRLKEWSRGAHRHGSCGKGIGELAFDQINHPDEVIRAGDLVNPDRVSKILTKIRLRKQAEINRLAIDVEELTGDLVSLPGHFSTDEYDRLLAAYLEMGKHLKVITADQAGMLVRNETNVVFEGAQGILLDEWRGFHPYTTWSNILPHNALTILKESAYSGDVKVIGVTRSYGTRHGAGPFPSEDTDRYRSSNENNEHNAWQGDFRLGSLDGVLLRYAGECLSSIGLPYEIFLTHLDVLDKVREISIVDSYLLPGDLSLDGMAEFQIGSAGISLKRLSLGQYGDLNHQSRLTGLLDKAIANKTDGLNDPQLIIRYIESITGAKVRYTSSSATAEGKRII